jgi:hypothetical protein
MSLQFHFFYKSAVLQQAIGEDFGSADGKEEKSFYSAHFLHYR